MKSMLAPLLLPIRGVFQAYLAVLLISASSESRAEPAAPPFVSRTDDFGGFATKNWPMVGGDRNNTRFSRLSLVNTRNVNHLMAAWVSKKFDEGATSKVTPVVMNGLMFITAGRRVYALDAKSGANVWSYKTVPDSPTSSVGKASEAGEWWNSTRALPTWKGVGLGQGMVFVGLQDGHVIALAQSTGRLIWIRQTGVDQLKKGQWATVPPAYVKGIVFMGLSDGDHHLRGRLTALDAGTGHELWQMFAIPGLGETGHETWASFNDAWRFGGGGVWTNAAVDPDLGLVYATTGNAVPPFAGDWRPGSNLFTCSVIAVDIKTGKLKWYYQLVHHDVFEADVGTPIVLFDKNVNGKSRKALAVLRADGYIFQLDRETGKPLLAVQERPVPQLASQMTSPVQPFPVDGSSILMGCEEWKKERIPAGFVLGCMWTPPASPPPSEDPQNVLAPLPVAKGSMLAYSPQSKYFYAQGISMLGWPRRAQDPYFQNESLTVPGLKTYGELAAIDGRTGKLVWKRRMPAALLGGGPLATAGGLIFRTSGDGNVEASDAASGQVLWQFQTGATEASGAPVTYEIEGEQYIAATMGSAVWAFKLGGKISSVAAPIAASEEDEFAGPVTDTDEIETTSLERSLIEPGMRYFIDEYTFNPYRARVTVGSKVLFVNNGSMRHEIIALDGSWGTGPLSPTEESWVSFDKPGKYVYICKNHPWTYGEIIVSADSPPQDRSSGATGEVQGHSSRFVGQAVKGKVQFDKYCGSCHGEDLRGRSQSPALLGESFSLHWMNGSVGDLFDKIRATMPQSSPGSLDTQSYLNIIAYLIRANEMVPANGELEGPPEVLRLIEIRKAK